MNMRLFASLIILFAPGLCLAAEVDVSIPLQDGRLGIVQLRQTLESELHLPESALNGLPDLDIAIDIRGLSGLLFVRAVNGALGDGFHLAVDEAALRISID